MKNQLKIAIYSGSIPSTTFIENSIEEVAKEHKVLLFGNIKQKTVYKSKNIKIIETPYNKWKYIPLTLWRMARLLVSHPKRILIAYNRAKQYPTNYLKLIRFTRYIAVMLYLPDIFHLQWARRIERWTFLREHFDCKILLGLLGTQIAIAPYNNLHLADSFRKHFPQVDGFNAVSRHTANEALKYGANPEVIKIIPMPINQKAFEMFRLPVKQTKRAFRMVSVGRHNWVKGYSYAIEAVKKVIETNLQIEYTIIAAGKPEEELIFQTHQLGLGAIINFKGKMDQSELFRELQNYDLMLLPSVSEGIANVVVEAMALGVPVLTTNCGGMNEIVQDNQTGWLVPTRNSEAIAVALKKIMGFQQIQIQTVAQKAHDRVKNEFHPQRCMPQYINWYEAHSNET